MESKVLRQIKDIIETFAGNDGHIDHKEFEDAVTTCKKAAQGKRTDVQCKKMVIQVIEDNSFKVKSGGWFASDWYGKAKKEAGLA